MSEPLLSISTLVEKSEEYIEINGEPYFYANPKTWGGLEPSIVNECWSTHTKLTEKSKDKRLNKAEVKQNADALNECLDYVLPGWPKDANVSEEDKSAIIAAFLGRNSRRTAERVKQIVSAAGVTGASSSQLSSAITAEIARKAG